MARLRSDEASPAYWAPTTSIPTRSSARSPAATGGLTHSSQGPINFGTMDGILVRTPAPDGGEALVPKSVVDAMTLAQTDEHRRLADRFWRRKDMAYRRLIHRPEGLLADEAARLFAHDVFDALGDDLPFLTDEALFERAPGIDAFIVAPGLESRVAERAGDGTVDYTARSYGIDEGVPFFGPRRQNRYWVMRAPAHLTVTRRDGGLVL